MIPGLSLQVTGKVDIEIPGGRVLVGDCDIAHLLATAFAGKQVRISIFAEDPPPDEDPTPAVVTSE